MVTALGTVQPGGHRRGQGPLRAHTSPMGNRQDYVFRLTDALLGFLHGRSNTPRKRAVLRISACLWVINGNCKIVQASLGMSRQNMYEVNFAPRPISLREAKCSLA